jgi:radical SAM-linked protein
MLIDNTPIKQRFHITFGKFDALIYTSNLDLAKLWERVLRRASLPILYSQGFNPRPRIQLATALPLGISSECEILDVSLREKIELGGLIERLTATSPAGLRIYKIMEVPVRSAALQTLVRSAEYRIHFADVIDLATLQDKIEQLLASDRLDKARAKDGKTITVNARLLVYDLRLDEQGDLITHLAVGDQGTIRPDDVLEALGLTDVPADIHRFRLHLDPTT